MAGGLFGVSVWTMLAVFWLALVGVVLAFVDGSVQRLPNPLAGAAAGGVLGT